MIEPFGEWKDDFRFATLESIISNIVISLYGKKGAKPTTPEQFMPKRKGEEYEPEKQSVEEMKLVLSAIASANHLKIKKRKK